MEISGKTSRPNLNVFNSRIGRRIFTAFVASALIPVVALTILSLAQVTGQLENQAFQRLRQAAKRYSLSVYEHLLFCEDELKLTALLSGTGIAVQQGKFEAIGRRLPDGRYETILGDPIAAVTLTPLMKNHLKEGNTVAVITGNNPVRIILVRHFDTESGKPGLLMGVVRKNYLWGLKGGNNLPPLTECTVTTSTDQILYRSSGWPSGSDVLSENRPKAGFRVATADNAWFAASWSLFMKPKFETGEWSVLVMQPEAHILAPIGRFKLIFVLVVALALLLVVSLSLFNLRRSLGPIHALTTGARCIARKDFTHRVRIASNDEFEEVARSFNKMSDQLGQHFKILSAQAQIDRASLMANDFGQIASLTISRLLKNFSLHLAAISRVNADDSQKASVYMVTKASPETIFSHPFRIHRQDLRRFQPDLPWITLNDPVSLKCYLPSEYLVDLKPVTLFPVFYCDELYALLSVAGADRLESLDDRLPLIRQISDHLALAWSNVDRIEDLRRMTLGSMEALARAVDAKSPWTAGHSARVTDVALSIARQMKLHQDRVDRLQRGALLHDIGKIGVPATILDKPGKLTESEFATVRNHSVIGDRILRPIGAFKEIIPMVRQHHERWDGKGYPDGLAGKDIVLEARILAVADVYDAMASDRPYRKAMPPSRVISIIASEAGRQFDPEVVTAFMDLMKQKSALAA